jgi:hypothetical protein
MITWLLADTPETVVFLFGALVFVAAAWSISHR